MCYMMFLHAHNRVHLRTTYTEVLKAPPKRPLFNSTEYWSVELGYNNVLYYECGEAGEYP